MKILIIDDHPLFVEGLRYVLSELDDCVDIVDASDFEQALQYISANPDMDLVLLDISMPGRDGFAALEFLAKQFPALPVVIVSASTLRSDMQRALDAGALGFITKNTNNKVVLNALRLVLSGGIYVPQELMSQQRSETSPNITVSDQLTPRQIEVLVLLARGRSNKEIALAIDVTEATVKMHVTAIFRTLGVTNRTQAALSVEKMGLNLLQD